MKSKKATVCPGRYVSSIYFYLWCVYTYLHHRELCFKEWRKTKKDGVPDSAFDDYWQDLSAKAKKVRVALGSHTASTYTLLFDCDQKWKDQVLEAVCNHPHPYNSPH